MRNTLSLKANADLKSRYKALLREEWASLLDHTLQLIDDQLRLSGIRLILPWEATEQLADRSQVLRILKVPIDELAPILQSLHSAKLPPVPEAIPEKHAGRAAALPNGGPRCSMPHASSLCRATRRRRLVSRFAEPRLPGNRL